MYFSQNVSALLFDVEMGKANSEQRINWFYFKWNMLSDDAFMH